MEMTQTYALKHTRQLIYRVPLHLYLNCPSSPSNHSTRRCLGTDFLPFLPMVIAQLLEAINQEVTVGTAGVDLEELEQRYGMRY